MAAQGSVRAATVAQLEGIVLGILEQLLVSGDARLFIPGRRSWQDVRYDSDKQLHVLAADRAPVTIRFANQQSTKSFVAVVRVLDLVHGLLVNDLHATKRDIYYTDVQVFGKQEVANRAIESLACMLAIPRSQLHVLGTEKGLVAGALSWTEGGHRINCRHFTSTVSLAQLFMLGVDTVFLGQSNTYLPRAHLRHHR